jgi:predicted nucleic acid-binding protein
MPSRRHIDEDSRRRVGGSLLYAATPCAASSWMRMRLTRSSTCTGAYEVMRSSVDQGQLEVLFTHVTIDELAATPDEDRGSRLLLLLVDLGHLIPTGAVVLDFSRLNFARLASDTEAVEAFRSDNIDHTRDAPVAVTAQHEHCALVTNDERLTNRGRERGVEVITPAELLADLGFDVQSGSANT